MGCSNFHKLIASRFDFLDLEAQISYINLCAKSLYYVPSLFHFLENKDKNPPDPSKNDQERLDKVDKFLYPLHSSSSMASLSEADGNLSITSTMQKLTSGEHHITLASIFAASHSYKNFAQELLFYRSQRHVLL